MALNLSPATEFPGDGSNTTAREQPVPLPDELAPSFPQLEILRCLGRGGMGVVYLARQRSLDRLVALKILVPEHEHDWQFAQRFEREARSLARLNHPHIVTIYDYGQAGGYFYLLMEFVDGVNIRQLLQTRKLQPKEALAIVPPICEALQYAHDHGIVHQDIKPENLLLDTEGRVKIADFGIARLLDGGKHPSAGQVAGTPGYMAPEQSSSPAEVDNRADIYSLGVVFYEMLTGELPSEQLQPPSKRVLIDVRLDEVVLRALETSPDLRWQSAAELGTRVETIATSPRESMVMQPTGATSIPAHMPYRRGIRKRSEKTFCGLRWYEIALGPNPETGEVRGHARAIFAIGDIATGVVALGGLARGAVAVGGLALGLFCFGGLSIGVLLAFGGLALGGVALGGLAIGAFAAGGGAVGFVAVGGGAVGYYALGGGAFGKFVVSAMERSPEALAFFRQYLPWLPGL